ncbi:MAG: CaiB/BaiF CoA transferase family protein, partial [Alphaproteobacteria bacterium]
FRPGVMDRLGIGYAALSAINPRLVYCGISGFGATGPMAGRPSFDIVTQALSGAMSVNGEPGQPPVKLGLPLGDLVGGIYGSIGVLAALNERHATGRGRKIDLSLLDGLIGMLGYLAQLYFVNGRSPGPVGTRHPNLVPYGAFKASDGYIVIACLTEEFWHNLARAIGQPDLPADARFKDFPTRLGNREALDAIVQAAIAERTVADWMTILDEHDVPHAPILSVGQALDHPNTAARGMVETVTHPTVGEMRLVGRPIRYEGAPQAPLAPPPLHGENSAAILGELLGMDAAELDRLVAAGAVVRHGDPT